MQVAIVKGELPPGEKIREIDLCERFQLTRGPLREAIGRLESRGLLVRRPHAGVTVVTINALADVLADMEAEHGPVDEDEVDRLLAALVQ